MPQEKGYQDVEGAILTTDKLLTFTRLDFLFLRRSQYLLPGLLLDASEVLMHMRLISG